MIENNESIANYTKFCFKTFIYIICFIYNVQCV